MIRKVIALLKTLGRKGKEPRAELTIDIPQERLPIRLSPRQQKVHDLLEQKQSSECPLARFYLGAIYALDNNHNPDRLSQSAQSLRELLEKLPRILSADDVLPSVTGGNMKKIRDNISTRLLKDKKLRNGNWKGTKITNHLDTTLRKIEKYLELNRKPDRSVETFRSTSSLDPLANVLSDDIISSKYSRFMDTWKGLQGYAHHRTEMSDTQIKEYFYMCEEIILEALAPVTVADQRSIHDLISLDSPDEEDIAKALPLITKAGANYIYFWNNLKSVEWLPHLKDKGYFKSPPNNQPTGDGYVRTPTWYPLRYLKRIQGQRPDAVVDLITQMDDTDNWRVMNTIADIAVEIENIALSLRLLPWVKQYIKGDRQHFSYDSVNKLIIKWASADQPAKKAALLLLQQVAHFTINEEGPHDAYDKTMPKPIVGEWEYQEIMNKGVRLLAEKEPLKTTEILIHSLEKLIPLMFPDSHTLEESGADSSEGWCVRVNKPVQSFIDAEQALVHTLTYACSKVYEQEQDSIEQLDTRLRKTNWNVFKRIRQHLYAQYVEKVDAEWIQEFICEEDRNYGERNHHYEFQCMLRIACETYGKELFNESELERYLNAILAGPNQQRFIERYKRWNETEPSQKDFEQRQTHFHRSQLRPFKSVLYGKYQEYYDQLLTNTEDELTDEDYYPTLQRGGLVHHVSPITCDQFSRMDDPAIFNYLQEWNSPEHTYSKTSEPIQIDHSVLSDTFEKHFKETIGEAAERVSWWLEQAKELTRPIYLIAVVKALAGLLQGKPDEQLREYFDFCEWVLSHEDSVLQKSWDADREDADPENPSWSSARAAVRYFAAKCLTEKAGLSQDWRKRVFRLLEKLCTDKDISLEEHQEASENAHRLINTAINHTRSQALEDLFDYANWVRKAARENCEVPEVKKLIEQRLEGTPTMTQPEQVLLAMHFSNMRWLDPEWAGSLVEAIFQSGNQEACFCAYLTRRGNHQADFEHFKTQYLYAFEHVGLKGEEIDKDGDDKDCWLINKWMGYHLLTFYLSGKIELQSESDLCLQRFYTATNAHRELWGDLFNHMGHSLRNWRSEVSEKIVDRVKAFFEWRLEAAEPTELSEYLYWLDGKCLDPEWRLDGFLRTHAHQDADDTSPSIVTEKLHEHFLESYPDKTIKCFHEVCKLAEQRPYFYLHEGSAKAILRSGLESENTETRELAEAACEYLLKAGQSEFLHLEAKS